MSISGLLGDGLEATGNPLGGVVSAAGGAVSGATDALASVGLNAIGSWVLGGTESALRTVAQVIGSATAPNLESTWFGSAYWRVAALAALLTVPFLFAAAIQALVRADLPLLARSAFVYLPVSLIGVGLAAPVTMLLLAATDQMSAAVSAVGVEGGARFLDTAAAAAAAYSAVDGSPFFVVVIGLFALMAALALALEMLIREAAVYVVVLMLPLGFAAMVWPARRIWATRLIELLVSLILSKFVIVAVLSLAGAAFSNGSASGISRLLVAMALVTLSVFAPWTLMRILPFTEVAAGAAGALRRDLPVGLDRYQQAANAGLGMVEPALGLSARFGGGSGRTSGDDEPLGGFASDPSPVGVRGGASVDAMTENIGHRDDNRYADWPGGSGAGGAGGEAPSSGGEAPSSGSERPWSNREGPWSGSGGPSSGSEGPSSGPGSLLPSGPTPAGEPTRQAGEPTRQADAASVTSEPGWTRAPDRRRPMDDFWSVPEWQDLRADSKLVTDGLTLPNPGEPTRTLDGELRPEDGPEGLS